MKLKLKNNKGQGDIIGAVGGFILLIVALVVGLLVVGTLQDSTVGDCTLGYLTVANSTTVANGTTQTWSVATPTLYTGSSALTGNLSVTAIEGTKAGANCTVAIGANSIGTLTNGTAVMSFDVLASYFSNPLTVTFASCGDQNVTSINATYYSLTACSYTADAFDAMDTTFEMNFSAMSLLPVIILLMAAVAVISAVLVLRRL